MSVFGTTKPSAIVLTLGNKVVSFFSVSTHLSTHHIFRTVTYFQNCVALHILIHKRALTQPFANRGFEIQLQYFKPVTQFMECKCLLVQSFQNSDRSCTQKRLWEIHTFVSREYPFCHDILKEYLISTSHTTKINMFDHFAQYV